MSCWPRGIGSKGRDASTNRHTMIPFNWKLRPPPDNPGSPPDAGLHARRAATFLPQLLHQRLSQPYSLSWRCVASRFPAAPAQPPMSFWLKIFLRFFNPPSLDFCFRSISHNCERPNFYNMCLIHNSQWFCFSNGTPTCRPTHCRSLAWLLHKPFFSFLTALIPAQCRIDQDSFHCDSTKPVDFH